MTYEMLVGEPPFAGPTAQAIVAKVLTEEPVSLVARRRTVPPAVEDAVLTALQKLPADRFASAKEFSDALDGTGPARTRVLRAARPAAASARARSLLLPALLLATAALAAWGWLRRGAAPEATTLARYEVNLPHYLRQRLSYGGGPLAISPDGGTIAYSGRRQGVRQLWVRTRDALEVRPIAGTDEGEAPFFSPDGKWLGYFANGRMFKVAVEGGPSILLVDSTNMNIPTGMWHRDGTITFVGPPYDLRRVAETGGPVTPLLAQPKTFVGWVFPSELPRTDAILATVCTNNCATMILTAVDLGSGEQRELVRGAARGWYVPDGNLVYARQDGGVFAQPFDPRTLTLSGAPVPIAPSVGVALGITPELAVSERGTMVHFDPAGTLALRVVRADRTGRMTLVDPDWQGSFNYFSVAPDGRRLALSINNVGRSEIWIKQLPAGPLSRLAFEGSNVNYRPVWHPDGRSVGFISDRTTRALAYVARADGSSPAVQVEIADTAQVDEFEWSQDLKWIVYRTGTYAGVRRIAMTAVPSKAGVEIEPGRFDSHSPTLSPDGRWLAYVGTETGREEVYVRPFPNTSDARWQVSTAGGISPVWAHSGRELFFVDVAGRLVTVSVAPGPTFQAGAPSALFSLDNIVLPPYHQAFSIGPDDQSFYFLEDRTTANAAGRYATLTLNALAGLGRPTARP
jgi:serine/threonine-protein kinase